MDLEIFDLGSPYQIRIRFESDSAEILPSSEKIFFSLLPLVRLFLHRSVFTRLCAQRNGFLYPCRVRCGSVPTVSMVGYRSRGRRSFGRRSSGRAPYGFPIPKSKGIKERAFRKAVKRVILKTSEEKWQQPIANTLTYSILNNSIPTVPTIANLLSTTPGTGDNNRIGDEVYFTRLSFRLSFSPSVNATSGSILFSRVKYRILVVEHNSLDTNPQNWFIFATAGFGTAGSGRLAGLEAVARMESGAGAGFVRA